MTILKLWARIQRDNFPLWEVAAAEPDYFEPSRLIRVKVKKPLGENSRIKVKGNAINSGWERMKMPWFHVGEKKFRVGAVNEDTCALLVKLKARVRVPKLEEQYGDELRTLRRKEMKDMKKGR